MSLEQKVKEQLAAAMKAQDLVAVKVLRNISAALLVQRQAGGPNNGVIVADEIKMLRNKIRQQREHIDFLRAGNPYYEEQVRHEEEVLQIMESLLPEKISSEELRAELQAIITQVGASSPNDMQKVIKVAREHFAGRAEDAEINAIVIRLLKGMSYDH